MAGGHCGGGGRPARLLPRAAVASLWTSRQQHRGPNSNGDTVFLCRKRGPWGRQSMHQWGATSEGRGQRMGPPSSTEQRLRKQNWDVTPRGPQLSLRFCSALSRGRTGHHWPPGRKPGCLAGAPSTDTSISA